MTQAAHQEWTDMADICFTGHRTDRLPAGCEQRVRDRIQRLVDLAIQKRHREFIAGGAMGVDHWAAEAVLGMEARGAILTVSVPHPQYREKKWHAAQRRDFDRLLARLRTPHKCHFVYNGKEPYNNAHSLERNIWMVEHSKIVFSVWDGVRRPSGTFHCLQYAWSKGRLAVNIFPDSGDIKVVMERRQTDFTPDLLPRLS